MKKITEQDKTFMREAIRLANESVERGGGPFGAVIVKNGEIIAGSSNSVTIDIDPTAHAEVNTIRQACRKLGTYDLSDCAIYAVCSMATIKKTLPTSTSMTISFTKSWTNP